MYTLQRLRLTALCLSLLSCWLPSVSRAEVATRPPLLTLKKPARVPRAEADSESPITDSQTLTPLGLRSEVLDLRLGMLLSVLADVGVARPQRLDNGFAATDGRLAFLGKLGSDFSFLFQGDLVRQPALLDFRLTYQPQPWLRLNLGRFKVPFSGEFLVPGADTDLNNRARMVRALAPGRSVGLELGGQVYDQLLFYRLGLFNGNGELQNDDGRLLVAARLGSTVPLSRDVVLTVALNAATSRDTAVGLPLESEAFAGRRQLLGLDGRLTFGPLFIATEWLYGHFAPVTGDHYTASGHHLTAGYLLVEHAQVLLRWDRFVTEQNRATRNLLIPSFSYVVPGLPPVQLQIDLEIPVVDPAQSRGLATATIAF